MHIKFEYFALPESRSFIGLLVSFRIFGYCRSCGTRWHWLNYLIRSFSTSFERFPFDRPDFIRPPFLEYSRNTNTVVTPPDSTRKFPPHFFGTPLTAQSPAPEAVQIAENFRAISCNEVISFNRCPLRPSRYDKKATREENIEVG